MGQIAERLGPLPCRERVRGEALVDQGHGGLEVRFAEIWIVIEDLGCEQQALVTDRAGRDGHRVIAFDAFQPSGTLRAFAHDEQLAFPCVTAQAPRIVLPEEDLVNVRLGFARQPAHGSGIGWDAAPPDHPQALAAGHFFDHLPRPARFGLARGHEHHADAVLSRRGQGESFRGGLSAEESVGDLQEQSGPVPRVGIAAAGTAVREVDQHLDALLNDLVTRPALDVSYETDATGIVFEAGVV